MAKTVTLHNRSRRAQVFNLPYRLCGDLDFCHRQMRGRVVQLNTGEKKVKPENARLSRSITLLGKMSEEGSSLSGLPLSVLKAPEVANALKRGDLRASFQDDEEHAASEEEGDRYESDEE